MTDWSAALGPDARRLELRLVRATASDARGIRWVIAAMSEGALDDGERAWIAEREADRAYSVVRSQGQVSIAYTDRAPWLADDLAIAKGLRHLAGCASFAASSARIFGVVNVTPDSFSDGGRWLEPALAIEHGLRLIDEGADVVDVGAESTRPGADPVGEDEELRRVVPVIEGLAQRTEVPISVDTTKSAVARAALDVGARIVNDVSAGTLDPRMLPLVAERGAGLVLMHMQGSPSTMQREPRYERDVVVEVLAYLRERATACVATGIAPQRLVIDPGIGFGKRLEHNLALLRRTLELRSLGLAVLIGASRKSFIAAVDARARIERSAPDDRLGGTLAATCAAARAGADFVRVHDVHAVAQALRVERALDERSLDFPPA